VGGDVLIEQPKTGRQLAETYAQGAHERMVIAVYVAQLDHVKWPKPCGKRRIRMLGFANLSGATAAASCARVFGWLGLRPGECLPDHIEIEEERPHGQQTQVANACHHRGGRNDVADCLYARGRSHDPAERQRPDGDDAAGHGDDASGNSNSNDSANANSRCH
jgi:hypothetical protein